MSMYTVYTSSWFVLLMCLNTCYLKNYDTVGQAIVEISQR